MVTPIKLSVKCVLFFFASAAGLWLARDRFGYLGASDINIVLFSLFFSFVFGVGEFIKMKIHQLRLELSKAHTELSAALIKIENLEKHDPLTGALTRNATVEELDYELLRSKRTGHPFCFAVIAIDQFRELDERYGSKVSDSVLKALAEASIGLLRTLDRFGRVGSTEFGIVLPVTWLDQGMLALGRLTKLIDTWDLSHIAPELNMTFSAGITTYAVNDTAEGIIKRAEEALAQAKSEGHKRIVQIEGELPELLPGMD